MAKAEKQSIFEKNFKPEEVVKLKTILGSCHVTLTHIKDLQVQMKELVDEAAEELELNPADIRKAAKAIYSENIASKRADQESLEEMLEIAGYDITGPTDV